MPWLRATPTGHCPLVRIPRCRNTRRGIFRMAANSGCFSFHSFRNEKLLRSIWFETKTVFVSNDVERKAVSFHLSCNESGFALRAGHAAQAAFPCVSSLGFGRFDCLERHLIAFRRKFSNPPYRPSQTKAPRFSACRRSSNTCRYRQSGRCRKAPPMPGPTRARFPSACRCARARNRDGR